MRKFGALGCNELSIHISKQFLLLFIFSALLIYSLLIYLLPILHLLILSFIYIPYCFSVLFRTLNKDHRITRITIIDSQFWCFTQRDQLFFIQGNNRYRTPFFIIFSGKILGTEKTTNIVLFSDSVDKGVYKKLLLLLW